ncbi:hypothetical protein [Flavobacterium piscisymbiosum]|uniref:Uncharacterized protein n=1 Tax=Flavobacterium piscisymbiosum TaxID=2893753 RepID=A0ABS8MH78_9FLAO|nr:hypothetical protein [Flavobacterium sp. F-30]MCC9064841.1 hypothetical protein [Flavobacterium sp. F-30]
MLEKLPIIENYYYVAIIAFFTFVLTMITAKGSLTDHRYKWYKWKRYTPRGKQAIGFGLLVALTLFLQDINNRNVSKDNDKKLSDKETLRAKEIKAGVKNATDQLFDGLSLAFKKQGLQYDTIKNQVIKLKDSVKTTIINGEPPILSFSNLQIVDSSYFKKTYSVKFTLICKKADSYNTNITVDIFAVSPNSNIYTIKRNINILYRGQIIQTNEELSNTITIPKDTSFYSFYAFRLKGYYFKHDKTKIDIDNFYLLRPRQKLNYFQFPLQIHEDIFRSYLYKNNFY